MTIKWLSEEKIKKSGVPIYDFCVLIYESQRYVSLLDWLAPPCALDEDGKDGVRSTADRVHIGGRGRSFGGASDQGFEHVSWWGNGKLRQVGDVDALLGVFPNVHRIVAFGAQQVAQILHVQLNEGHPNLKNVTICKCCT